MIKTGELGMEWLKDKRVWWLVELLLFIIAFYYVYRFHGGNQSAPPPAGKGATKSAAMVSNGKPRANAKLETAVVCLDVDEEVGKPLLAKGVFSKYIDYLYCFAEFSGAAPDEVVFYWIYKESIIAQKRVRSAKDYPAAWSRLSMSPDKTGEWRVDVQTADGRFLGSASFILK